MKKKKIFILAIVSLLISITAWTQDSFNLTYTYMAWYDLSKNEVFDPKGGNDVWQKENNTFVISLNDNGNIVGDIVLYKSFGKAQIPIVFRIVSNVEKGEGYFTMKVLNADNEELQFVYYFSEKILIFKENEGLGQIFTNAKINKTTPNDNPQKNSSTKKEGLRKDPSFKIE